MCFHSRENAETAMANLRTSKASYASFVRAVQPHLAMLYVSYTAPTGNFGVEKRELAMLVDDATKIVDVQATLANINNWHPEAQAGVVDMSDINMVRNMNGLQGLNERGIKLVPPTMRSAMDHPVFRALKNLEAHA